MVSIQIICSHCGYPRAEEDWPCDCFGSKAFDKGWNAAIEAAAKVVDGCRPSKAEIGYLAETERLNWALDEVAEDIRALARPAGARK